MAYISFQPTDFFNILTYVGTGSSQAITGVGFQPDFVWCKQTDGGNSHMLADAVRGVNSKLSSNDTAVANTGSTFLTAFGADGFTGGGDYEINGSGGNYVNWNWKGANGTVTNTAGSKDSTVSVSTTAGISIVKWNNDTSDAISIGHGLGAIPDAIIVKEIDGTGGWHSRFKSFAANDYIILNSPEAKGSSTSVFGTLPTSTLFYTGTAAYHTNANLIAYCFKSIRGFSSIGTYESNENINGPFIYTGFKPALVIIKNIDRSEGWDMYDIKRNPGNITDNKLKADSAVTQEVDSTVAIDILSNGFKIRTTSTEINHSTCLYMAFAEFPVASSNSKSGTAR